MRILAGAASVGMAQGETPFLVFGYLKLGTPALQADMRVGLYLPLQVPVHADEAGQTQIVYEDPAEMLADLDVPGDAAVLMQMSGAPGKLADKTVAQAFGVRLRRSLRAPTPSGGQARTQCAALRAGVGKGQKALPALDLPSSIWQGPPGQGFRSANHWR